MISYPLSLHGVGLSIGADRPLDADHLRRLRALVTRYTPAVFSEHLAWSSHDVGFLNDLLPVPYTAETLARVVDHIDELQEALGRQMLLENPSTYLAFAESTYAEIDFIAEIVRRTGCGLLLDVNNVYVASTNQAWDPFAYIDVYPLAAVQEIHLAGHAQETDEKRPSAAHRHTRPPRRGGRVGSVRPCNQQDRSRGDPDRMGRRSARMVDAQDGSGSG